ncbi:MAG: hypothetical protein KAW92_01485 [Candidatus Cloacimonetes bacterium]|nr:hypothetical protein [Candidatus Cloacimonadota bacterium]
MINKEQKYEMFYIAIDVGKKYASGGSCKVNPEVVIKYTYEELIELITKIETEN